MSTPAKDAKVAVLVDCDNIDPAVLAYALRVAAQFGRVVVRRGYGNHATLSHKWQTALVENAFIPCLQFQYASGKNTADIALALDALELKFDDWADTFCLVTSDSDFSYLCRKLRERDATVCIVGEPKTPKALRNASDQFCEWVAEVAAPALDPVAKAKEAAIAITAKAASKSRPKRVIQAVEMLSGDTPEGKVHVATLGQYLKRTDPGFSPSAHGHSGLLEMLKTYDLLKLNKEPGGHYTISLARPTPEAPPQT
jgi:uncharacterized protein (TIGR00288 family)